jgi:hypothetical protein
MKGVGRWGEGSRFLGLPALSKYSGSLTLLVVPSSLELDKAIGFV